MKNLNAILICLLIVQAAPAQDAGITLQQAEVRMKEYPVLWQQQSAEYRALCYQAFNLALLRLNEIPRRQFKKQSLAIITDLDETILDNSYSEAQLIKDGKSYSSEAWKNWTNRSAATAVPGAVAFLQAASQKGAHIFYISNRDTSDIPSTLLNLQKLQLPDADTSHMLFLTNTSSKEARRQLVMSKYKVIMLLGDNLTDFTTAFEKNPAADRKAETDKVQEEWGKKFIVLPNATYGEWENAVYDYKRGLSPEERESLRKGKLVGY
jgi:5'-nucleotidase (lipoprotein e(P4) family)